MKPTTKQMVLLRYHANKSSISINDILMWLDTGEITISQIVAGILWVKVK